MFTVESTEDRTTDKTRVGTSLVNSWKGLQMVSEKRRSSTQQGPAWKCHGTTNGGFQPFSTWYSPDTTGCRVYPGAIHIMKKKFEFSGVKTGELDCSQKPQRTSKQEAKIIPASDIGTPTDRTRSCPCPRSAAAVGEGGRCDAKLRPKMTHPFRNTIR